MVVVGHYIVQSVSAESQSGKENTFQYDHLEGSHRDLHPQSPFKWLLWKHICLVPTYDIQTPLKPGQSWISFFITTKVLNFVSSLKLLVCRIEQLWKETIYCLKTLLIFKGSLKAYKKQRFYNFHDKDLPLKPSKENAF